MYAPQEAEWMTIAALLEHARAHDPKITARTLEGWRHEGLLPRSRRIGQNGQAPVHGVPASSAAQLDALMFWRRHTKNPDALRVLLWVDGWDIDLEAVRGSLAATLTGINERLRDELGACVGGLAELARRAASQRRGNTVIPRLRGVPEVVRARVADLLLAPILGRAATPPTRDEAIAAIRLTGIDPRKSRNVGLPRPFPAGPPEMLFAAAGQLPGIDRLIALVAESNPEELRAARVGANVMVVQLPVFATLITAVFREGTGTPIELARGLRDKPLAYPLAAAFCLALARAGLLGGLEHVERALAPFAGLADQVAAARSAPRELLAANLEGNPRGRRRVLGAIEGPSLDDAQATLRRQGPYATRTAEIEHVDPVPAADPGSQSTVHAVEMRTAEYRRPHR
jgi:hypothetical protein